MIVVGFSLVEASRLFDLSFCCVESSVLDDFSIDFFGARLRIAELFVGSGDEGETKLTFVGSVVIFIPVIEFMILSMMDTGFSVV